ncbi:MAG: hypothetical protein GEU94_13905 [Micromonosporaceae bacterium]|nr:hypothetical protein [Micromonosporaceae bacterium]
MSLLTAEIPSIDTAPQSATPSAMAKELRLRSASRRTVLRFAMGAGMTIGVSAIGLLPGAGKAHAGWYSTYATWTGGCRGYYSSSTICYPSSWDVSSYNCNGRGYHRDDGWSMTCSSGRHYVKLTACDGKNAWHWTSTRTRCSDGYRVSYYCGGPSGGTRTESICKHRY